MSTDYIYATGTHHSSSLPYPIVVASLSDLTRISKVATNDEIFDQALRKLDPLVGDGYVLVVLAAEAEGRGREPGLGWWISKWRGVPRNTWFIHHHSQELSYIRRRSVTRIDDLAIIPLILPFLSPKAYAKLHTITSILQLHTQYGISLRGIRIPLTCLEEEARQRPASPGAYPTRSTGTWTGSLTSALGVVGSYIPFSGMLSTPTGSAPIATSSSGKGEGYWNRSVDELVESCNGVPPLFNELRKVILEECITTEGIFRRTPGPQLRPVIVDILDMPLNSQPTLPWRDIAVSDPLLPPKILSRLLSQSSVPMIRPDQYKLVRQCTTVEHIKDILLPQLSPSTRLILTHVVSTLHQVSHHSSDTKMTPLNLAICIAPDLIKGPDAMEDASMCLQPGRKMPTQMGGGGSEGEGAGTLVGVLEIWTRDFNSF